MLLGLLRPVVSARRQRADGRRQKEQRGRGAEEQREQRGRGEELIQNPFI